MTTCSDSLYAWAFVGILLTVSLLLIIFYKIVNYFVVLQNKIKELENKK